MRLTCLCLLATLCSFQASEDYKTIFGKDYAAARFWFVKNDSFIQVCCAKYQVPPQELSAIVFPEVMRYNSFSDALETTALSFLYTSQGKAYADFSVGYFQMKPSFAEQVEADYSHLPEAEKKRLANTFLPTANQSDTEAARKQRIHRITSTEGQLIYLIAFYKICFQQFKTIIPQQPDDRLRFLATCYNAGYKRTTADIERIGKEKYFHLGKGFAAQKYNYADIVAFAYRHWLQ